MEEFQFLFGSYLFFLRMFYWNKYAPGSKYFSQWFNHSLGYSEPHFSMHGSSRCYSASGAAFGHFAPLEALDIGLST